MYAGERLVSNWSRLVVIVWVFVVWILTSSYSASFSSLLTLQQLKTINDIEHLIKNGDNVGYRQGSFVVNLLKDLKVEESKLKAYSTPEEYAEALSKRAVGAIFDEIPYLRLFLARSGNCAQYKMNTPGLGTTCSNEPDPSNSLTLDSFWGLFLITGAVSILAFSIFLFLFLSRNGHV
ncbi:glutamate receptor 2.3-like protein [Cinnamomum micranthum f. kanehirae]|uniref:Glutamate receptor 2.3-like protein n=1 Tax=Cinnamomum micranthum f. kanehirae TaxID=337451 RepID=A0A3S3PXI2_9MAGN|nr:glutamate receptor 2.3-like protein [Cinnamomum micranthum f. kanehirae]